MICAPAWPKRGLRHVRRWQARALLNWSEGDIVEVTRHLNDTIYHFPQGGDRV